MEEVEEEYPSYSTSLKASEKDLLLRFDKALDSSMAFLPNVDKIKVIKALRTRLTFKISQINHASMSPRSSYYTGITGIELIAQERQDQIYKHHMDTGYDLSYNSNNQLIAAMAMFISNLLLLRSGETDMPEDFLYNMKPEGWNEGKCREMLSKSEQHKIAIIGALAAAEIDRHNELQARVHYVATPPNLKVPQTE